VADVDTAGEIRTAEKNADDYISTSVEARPTYTQTCTQAATDEMRTKSTKEVEITGKMPNKQQSKPSVSVTFSLRCSYSRKRNTL